MASLEDEQAQADLSISDESPSSMVYGEEEVEKSFQCLTVDDVKVLASRDVEEITEVLQLPIDAAEELLHTHRWNKADAITAYISEGAGNHAPLGSRRKWKKLKGNVFCATCLDEKDGERDIVSTDCGIAVCKSCWAGYFRSMLGDCMRGLIRCPFPECLAIVPLWLIEQCFTSDSQESRAIIIQCYRNEYMSDFVQMSEDLQFCPSPACDFVIQVMGGNYGNKPVTCKCGFKFCFSCLTESHFPATCDEAHALAKYTVQLDILRLAESFKETKPCRSCGVFLENPEGCSNFTCALCGNSDKWNEMPSCAHRLSTSLSEAFSKDGVAPLQLALDEMQSYRDREMAFRCRVQELLLDASEESICEEKIDVELSRLSSMVQTAKWIRITRVLRQNDNYPSEILQRAGDTMERHLREMASLLGAWDMDSVNAEDIIRVVQQTADQAEQSFKELKRYLGSSSSST